MLPRSALGYSKCEVNVSSLIKRKTVPINTDHPIWTVMVSSFIRLWKPSDWNTHFPLGSGFLGLEASISPFSKCRLSPRAYFLTEYGHYRWYSVVAQKLWDYLKNEELPSVVKFIETESVITESRMRVTRGYRERGNGELFNGIEFQFGNPSILEIVLHSKWKFYVICILVPKTQLNLYLVWLCFGKCPSSRSSHGTCQGVV